MKDIGQSGLICRSVEAIRNLVNRHNAGKATEVESLPFCLLCDTFGEWLVVQGAQQAAGVAMSDFILTAAYARNCPFPFHHCIFWRGRFAKITGAMFAKIQLRRWRDQVRLFAGEDMSP